jgi:hypothetical protein
MGEYSDAGLAIEMFRFDEGLFDAYYKCYGQASAENHLTSKMFACFDTLTVKSLCYISDACTYYPLQQGKTPAVSIETGLVICFETFAGALLGAWPIKSVQEQDALIF